MTRRGDIPLVVRHPVPMRLVGSRGGRERVTYGTARTPAVMRGVTPSSLAVTFPGIPALRRIRTHAGRMWEAIEVITGDPGDQWLRALDPETAVSILQGTVPHEPINAWIMHGPLGTAYPTRVAPEWIPDGPVPARIRERLVEDIEPLARAAVRAFLAEDLVHDGTRVYQRLPAPKLRGATVGFPAAPGGIELHIPEPSCPHLTYAASPSQAREFARFVAVVGGFRHFALPRGDALGRVVLPRDVSRMRLREDDAHVGEFVHMAPPRLMQVLASLDRIALSPEADELIVEARAHEARLAPWFARGLVRLTPREDWCEAIDGITRAAGFLARVRGDPHSREELEAMAAFGRIVAAASFPPPVPPDEDLDAMGVLTPAR